MSKTIIIFFVFCRVLRTQWVIDNEIPIFKDEGREYIEKFIDLNC